MCFGFQNRFSTCPLERQRTSQWRMRSPYFSSSSSQYSLNCFLLNLFALISFTHLTTGTITCYKFKTSTQRILVNNAMILRRAKKLYSKSTAPAALPIIDGAPSVHTLKRLLKSNCWFLRNDFTLSNVHDPLVFLWRESKPGLHNSESSKGQILSTYICRRTRKSISFRCRDFVARKAEVLNSLVIHTTAKANDTTDILQRCTEDDNSCYRNVCKMSVVSFALAVVFIIRFCCSMEEVLEWQLLIRGHTFVTFSTIGKTLAGCKKSFRGPYVVQARSKPLISSKTLKSPCNVGVVETSQRLLLDYIPKGRITILIFLTTVKLDWSERNTALLERASTKNKITKINE